jgi:hypothetical protein
VEKLEHDTGLLKQLGLNGLIHVSGLAGSGKTLFAVALASDCAEKTHVEWICTDGKNSFISHLKRNVNQDRTSSISIQRPTGYHEVQKAIMDLPTKLHEDTSLIVIDAITRVLDMSHENPIMWGRLFFEDVLPTLAGLSASKQIQILLVSESRLKHEGNVDSVFHDVITKWMDHDLIITRDLLGKSSEICSYKERRLLANLTLDDQGTICIKPIHTKQEVTSNCSESCQVYSDM